MNIDESSLRNQELRALLADIVLVPDTVPSSCKISGIALNSQQVQQGNLFCAYPGARYDGRQFIADAVARGAAAIICEGDAQRLPSLPHAVPVIFVDKLQQHLGAIAAQFFGHPSRDMTVIGVTGTNGKTTVSYLLAQALSQLRTDCLLIGTLGQGAWNKLMPTSNTTPDPVSLQQSLYQSYISGVRYASMEVTSHALAQGRVNGINFSTTIFTNLSHEHLDYHGSFTAYIQAKRRLFFDFQLKTAIVNADCLIAQSWAEVLASRCTLLDCSLGMNQQASIRVTQAWYDLKGVAAKVDTPWGIASIESSLIGAHNLANLLAVFAALMVEGYSLSQVCDTLASLRTPPGRMECLTAANKPRVFVDYAHTPDALSCTLSALTAHKTGRLICVFGCGGDRDRAKRPLMAQAVDRYSDLIIVTDDNVRAEDPEQIFEDIRQGFAESIPSHRDPQSIIFEHDRSAAIHRAIELAQPQDIILIAGKGHEEYQLVGDQKLFFSDRQLVQTLLNARE